MYNTYVTSSCNLFLVHCLIYGLTNKYDSCVLIHSKTYVLIYLFIFFLSFFLSRYFFSPNITIMNLTTTPLGPPSPLWPPPHLPDVIFFPHYPRQI